MDFFQAIYEWFTVDVYQFVMDTLEYLAIKLIWMRIKFTIWLYTFAWGVASTLMADLSLALKLSNTLSLIPVEIRATLEYFNVFTGLSWVFQSFSTKFVMKFFSRS